MPIHKLEAKISEQIAAGEVVENPASVVKELVENSLDAGAKRIKVIFKKGGLKEITVIDDGSGIPSDEVRLALERFATSKISSLKDLQNIRTLGFRGEALPSIASVSKMSISTRSHNEITGRHIALEGGVEKENREIGFPGGTKVTVENLFFNTPARLKFLKGVPAEAAKISRVVHLLALSRPDVSFSLKKENDLILETPGDGKLINVIIKIFGHDLARELVPVNFESADFFLNGYVSNPAYSRNSRNYQLFYVNGRYVRSQLIKEALDKSFVGIVTAKRYPAAFLYLNIPFENIDVNVHPSKLEVRFHREEEVRHFLEKSLKKAFTPVYFFSKNAKQESAKEIKHNTKDIHNYNNNFTYNHYPQINLELQVKENSAPLKKNESNFLKYYKTEPFTENFWEGSIIGQAFATYIIVQKGEDLIFIDQHAAHERILWEKIQQSKEEKQYIQEILPLAVDLPLSITEILKDKLEHLKDIGLEMEHFGNNTFIIRTVPFYLQNIFSTELFLDILEGLSGMAVTDKEFQEEIQLRLSCKAAIKANKRLTAEEMSSLLSQLEKCENPFLCPHGRPVAIKIGKNELEKHFKRRG